MAEPVSAQDRLDKIVVLIAANMVAEVCSVYVLRVDGTLELYATEGLNRQAVHQTVMRANEGLVGQVSREAKSINLSDAHAHPAFSYRPETGEEIYRSFLGVPILRAGNTLGVLVVQNRAKRTYVEEEVEALQTTAMVLAEMIASGELSALALPGAEPAARRSLHFKGMALSEGIALGHVVLHEPRVVITQFIADDVAKERERLANAIVTLRADLDAYMDAANAFVTGTIGIKLYKGSARAVTRSSPHAVYDEQLASFAQSGGLFAQAASPGFIELWSLQSRMAWRLRHGGEDGAEGSPEG
jgi:phosphotransferase system enzyme I (PtsP)